MSACQNCGKEITDRNKQHFTTFLDKPLCAKWKPCYYRKTGKVFRVRQPYRPRQMSRSDAIKYQTQAIELYNNRMKIEAEHDKGAHDSLNNPWDACLKCHKERNERYRAMAERILGPPASDIQWREAE